MVFQKKINCDVLTMDLSDHEEHKSKAPFEKILEKSMIIEANRDLRGGQMAITFDLSEIILKRIPIRIHKSHENIILNPLFLREFFSENVFRGDKIFFLKTVEKRDKTFMLRLSLRLNWFIVLDRLLYFQTDAGKCGKTAISV